MAAKKGQPIFGEDGKPTGRRDTSTIITRQMMGEWTKGLGVIVRGGDVDEAPQAYRRLPDVLAAQGDTVRVLHTLTPLIVVMAGSKEYDPYKD
jgi:tRNA-splicing ligase RtcB